MFSRVFITGVALTISIQVTAFQVLKSYNDFVVPTDGKKTWYIFDIDNTLLHPTKSVGSVEWAENMKKRYEQRGLSPEAASEKQHELFGIAQSLVATSFIEYAEINFLGKLAKNDQVIALTARNKNLLQITLQQLANSGLRFAFQLNPIELTAKPVSFTYEQGIVFATGQDKGSIVETMLATTQQVPERIVFFDDKDYNVVSLEQAMQRINQNRIQKIEFDGYHYTAADKFVKSFDQKAADIEWLSLKYFGSNMILNPFGTAESLAAILMGKTTYYIDESVETHSCSQKSRSGDFVTMTCEYRVCDRWIDDYDSSYCVEDSLAKDKYEFILQYRPELGIYIQKGWDLF